MGASSPVVSEPPAQERRFNNSDDVVIPYEQEYQVKFIKKIITRRRGDRR